MNPILVPSLILAAAFALAIAEDLRSRRIPNAVTVAAFAAGLFWHAAGPTGHWAFDPTAPGAVGLAGAALAGLGMLAAFFPLYRLGVMGAGDVKLLAAVAACVGSQRGHWLHLVELALVVLAAGGVLSIARMLVAGTSREVLANVRTMAIGRAARLAGLAGPSFDPRRESADRMPYAIAIATGSFLYLAGTWTGWLRMF